MTQPVEIDVIVYQSGEFWIAQGLQYDVAVQARLSDLATLPKTFLVAMSMEIQVALDLGEEPLKSIPAAPKKYWDMHRLATIDLTARLGLPRVQNRVLSAPRIVPNIRLSDAPVAA